MCHNAGERVSGQKGFSTQPVRARSQGRQGQRKGDRFGNWHVTSDLCQSKTGWDRKLYVSQGLMSLRKKVR